MASFTVQVPLNARWNGLDFHGPAGTAFDIPDAFVDEFTNEVGRSIPGGVTWAISPDVTAFGATGDGVTDDTAAIMAAITATAAGSTLIIPPGTYLVSGITISKSLLLDMGTATIRMSGSGVAFSISGASGAHLVAPSIVGGTIDLNGLASVGVLFTYCDDPQITGTSFLSGSDPAGAAVRFLDCQRPRALSLSARAVGSGVILDGSPDGSVVGCTLYSMMRDGVLIYNGSNNASVIGVVVDGYNSAAMNGRAGVHAYGSDGVTVSGCSVSSGSVGGTSDSPKIRFRDSRHFSCAGNNVRGSQGSSGGIVVINLDDIGDGGGSGTIAGNTIEGVAGSGITCATGAGGSDSNRLPVAISANRIMLVSGGVGIAATGSVPVAITGNAVEGADNAGIQSSASFSSVSGNVVRNPGAAGSGNQDGILIWGGTASVVGNVCVDDLGVHKMTYGLRVTGAGVVAQQFGNVYSGATTAAAAATASGVLGVAFYGSTPIAKPSVSGSRSANAALASLLTALSNLGLITDSTSA